MSAIEKKEPGTVFSIAILSAISLLIFIPFANKAFHIDDPLFLWVARQIQSNPFDFYGFTVNWYGIEMPMSEVTKNPPLASYYIALIAYAFGWSEVVLHSAFIIPAVAAVIGTYFLARECCDRPMIAALVLLLSPVFFLSSTTVMCDVMMLSLWVWATYLWVRGMKSDSAPMLAGAAFLVAACGLTKYYGMSLIPLLFIYSLMKKRRVGNWVFFLLIPVLVLAAYQWTTHLLYGKGLLLDAASYATERRYVGVGLFAKALTGLAFTGGCLIALLFYSPFLCSRKKFLAGAVATGLIISAFPFLQSLGRFPLSGASGVKWLFIAQFSLFMVSGIICLAIAAGDLWEKRDADSLLLFLWILGTFIFATFLNWSVNGRSILPMVPAAAILLMRHLQQHESPGRQSIDWRLLLPLAPTLLVTLVLAWGDYSLADASRKAALQIRNAYGKYPGTIWFQGHWGFQYYMEMAGGKALDRKNPTVMPGDIVIIPSNNTNVKPLSLDVASPLQVFRFPLAGFLATMDTRAGAGFYSDAWGPLPYAAAPGLTEKYKVMLMTR